MMFYLFKLLFSGVLLCSAYSTVLPHTSESLIEISADECDTDRSFGFDEVSFADDDYDFMNDYLDTAGMDHISRAIDPIGIMTILNLLAVPTILQEPIFLHTNILNKRSLLDQPIFEPDRAEFPGKWVVGTSAFARKTERSNFTRGSDKLSSYLALTEASLLARLEDTINRINQLNPLPDFDIAKIFFLFENMTVEERQVGFMLHLMKRWRYTTLRIMAPLYYLESNFSLTKREQDAVAKELGVMEPEAEKRFRKAHFISDKIGLGDTRIEVDHTLLKRPSFTLRCGGLATIPTAWAWGGGFLGSSFAKPSTLPDFELETLFNVIENPGPESQQEAQDLLENFFLDSFDRIAADLIDIPLGNRRHLGLGVYMRGKTPLSAYIDNSFAVRTKLTNRISLELFLPSTEKRFYINKINEAGFASRDFTNTSDPAVAAENLQFLIDQLVSRLFLRAFNTRIIPGVIFRWSSMAQYKGEKFGFNLGTDFWLQNKDAFSSIHTPSPKARKEIDVQKAKGPVAQQSKIFGGVIFKHKTDKNTWFLSVNADATLNTKGLGQDYCLSFNFESSF